MLDYNQAITNLINHPHALSDLLFIVVASLIAALSQKGCAYRQSNLLLASQFMLTLGFSTLVIMLNMYDGLYFDTYMLIVYISFYHLITQTGDRFLGKLSLIIGAYHFARLFGSAISINTDEIIGLEYASIMNTFMIMQLLLAFRGFLNGIHTRIRHNHSRNTHSLGSHK